MREPTLPPSKPRIRDLHAIPDEQRFHEEPFQRVKLEVGVLFGDDPSSDENESK